MVLMTAGAPGMEETRRIRPLPVSAMARLPSGATARPDGVSSAAETAAVVSPAKDWMPVPAIAVSRPVPGSSRSTCWFWLSLMRMTPVLSTASAGARRAGLLWCRRWCGSALIARRRGARGGCGVGDEQIAGAVEGERGRLVEGGGGCCGAVTGEAFGAVPGCGGDVCGVCVDAADALGAEIGDVEVAGCVEGEGDGGDEAGACCGAAVAGVGRSAFPATVVTMLVTASTRRTR